MKCGLGTCLFLTIWFTSEAQEKNYEVISTSITCDKLPASFENKDRAYELITSSKYRYQQNFKIRRKSGLKAGEFYSCDNVKGFLIAHIDGYFEIYIDVLIIDWEALTSSNDPESLLKSFTVKYVKM